ncbi:MAG: hypothetical protein H6Q76_1042 [Firmicutes bacterium]|nr:hypothetical protein [Bacillota bacterium]
MLIQDMFSKPIDRDIKGVIKVGQADDENIRQELEEYVVTRELQRHFADFFRSYRKGVNGRTDKMGVWISGFFGSGKSHFLKILSYLLANREVNGKKALSYFVEDKKIADPMVLADMKLAADGLVDVILFNIDSKSDMAGKQSKDAIVSVFLKVFNEMQGFCGAIPILADLERHLQEQKRYEEFKERFAVNHGKSWEGARNRFDFIQDDIVDTLVEIGFMTEAAGRNWCEKAIEPYRISIEDFAKLVKQYLDRKGSNHHLVFLVDEIGQYIGDDSQLMLNLQTVTEDLGTACNGKVWIIVTSQQDIDAVTKTKGNDFSKIQGRFDTRLSLSSANVDEVIKERILKKNPTAAQTLRLLYEQKATIIKNLIVFNDAVEKKLYASEQDFADVYPFVPYQFNLLGSVLTSIRTHGASGKHLSEGERSMLALFKESADHLKRQEQGALVPFNAFYDALHQFLDHSHSSVVIKAADNRIINPEKEEDCFNVSVLKTLFMIKYVNDITANAENITSLMVPSIDADRIVLKKKVEDALNVLVRQMLVQKNGDLYVFLTDEEQEINREIENQQVETAEIINKVAELVFEDLYNEKKYRYPTFGGRYSFAFNQIVDDRPYKPNQSHDIGVRVLTPGSGYGEEETTLRMMSGQGKEVLVVLPNDTSFLNEIRSALKIEKFLRLNTAKALAKFDQIKEAKRTELRDRKDNAKLYLSEALKNAALYVNGDKAQIAAKDVATRINEALGRLVSTVYHKLSYIDAPMEIANIREMFKKNKAQILTLENGSEPNIHALNDMIGYIAGNSAIHAKTSMKSLMDRFMKAPYGFVEDDVEWLVAKLFKTGDVSLSVGGGSVTLHNKSEDEIVNYVTKKEYVDKLLIERREKPNEAQKKSVREVMKEVFGVSSVNEDDDALMDTFRRFGEKMLSELDKTEAMMFGKKMPGKVTTESGKKLLRSVLQIEYPTEFFRQVHAERDALLDFAEDYEPVKAFFAGEQKAIFERALDLMRIYEESKTFIVNDKVEECVTAIRRVLKKDAPYADIPQLPEWTNRFVEDYGKVLQDMQGPILAAIEDARKRVFEVLDDKPYADEWSDRFVKRFEEIRHKASHCNNVAVLQNVKVEVDALKVRLLNEMDKNDELIAVRKVAEQSAQYANNDNPSETAPQPKPKKKKNISIKTISISSSWQIETAADVDEHLAAMRERILNELEENTVVNIEF